MLSIYLPLGKQIEIYTEYLPSFVKICILNLNHMPIGLLTNVSLSYITSLMLPMTLSADSLLSGNEVRFEHSTDDFGIASCTLADDFFEDGWHLFIILAAVSV